MNLFSQIKRSTFFFLFTLIAFSCSAQTWPPSLKGRWTFDHAANLVQASLGNNLLLQGTHIAISGPTLSDSAVRIGPGSYYHCYHDIAANGSGTPQFVNQYSILIDFRIPQLGQWYTFFQTNYQNSNDGEAFINTSGQIGVGATGYSSFTVIPGEWYRLVISADLGNHYDYYIDGQLILSGGAQLADDRFALYPLANANDVLFFADDNGEDNLIDIAQIAIFDTSLTSSEISGLQGFGHIINNTAIKPYLETPTPTSINISWHNINITSTQVIYGTDSLVLSQSAIGTNIDNSGKRWHTTKLTGLNSNTTYYYRCISGADTSNIFPFRTPVLPNEVGGHIRFGIIGDSQTNSVQSALTATAMKAKFIELYGNEWYNKVNLILHTGDIVGSGANIGSFETEYFNSFSSLSCSVPFMISIGNHEGENNNFYNYMHYDEFSSYQYPNPLCERYYSFNLGNVQFLSMNTAGSYDNFLQTSWVQQKLDESATNPDVDFVFAYAHRPGHSELWPDGNASYVYNTIYPVFANYPKLAQHTFGHSHNFEHGTYISNNIEKRDFRTILNGGAGGDLDRWGMYTNQVDLKDVQISYDYHCYVIVDVDMDNQSYIATMYSLGNPDKSMYNVALDSWHGVVGRPAPATPLASFPQNSCNDTTPTLIASLFSGIDSLMSSEFQITSTPGNYSNPILDTLRDWTNIYGVTPSPNFVPIDKNLGIDLRRLTAPLGLLHSGNNYEWRVRYRDHNVRWSEWSQPSALNVVQNIPDSISFIADTTNGNAPLTVHFTDLSNVNATAWMWDFDNDGIFESNLRDPIWTYTSSGVYSVNLIVNYGGTIGNKLKTSYIIVGTNGVNSNFLYEKNIIVYPNPVNNELNLYSLPENENCDISICDISGRIIYSGNSNRVKSLSLDTNNFDQGIYFLTISNRLMKFEKKICILR